MQLRSPLASSNCMRGLTRTATLTDSPESSLEKIDWLVVSMMLGCVGFVCGLMLCSKVDGCDVSLDLFELDPFAIGLFDFILFKFIMWTYL